jgi:hypothetical protein
MKSYRAGDGTERIWFEADEIEQIVEDELHKAGLYPSVQRPAVNVEDFIELHLKIKLDQHASLNDDVLGMTEFTLGQAPTISINRDLSGSAVDLGEALPGRVGRWRATLAHEACHVLLHRILFEFDDRQGVLFASDSAAPTKALMRCLKREVSFLEGGRDWREVQANKGMAALLMPRATFRAVARLVIAESGVGDMAKFGEKEAGKVVPRLADLLQVSKQAARIRLSSLGYLAAANMPLPLETPLRSS